MKRKPASSNTGKSLWTSLDLESNEERIGKQEGVILTVSQVPRAVGKSESRMRENRTFGLMRGKEVYRPALPTLLMDKG